MDPKIVLLIGGAAVLYLMSNKKKLPPEVVPFGTARPLDLNNPLPGVTPEQAAAITAAQVAAANQNLEPPSGNSLSAIYARMQAAAATNGMAAGGSPDQWNWLLSSVSSLTPPDPLEVWPGYDRGAGMTLTLDQYWGTMAAYLRTSRGMAGFRRAKSYAHPAGGWIT